MSGEWEAMVGPRKVTVLFFLRYQQEKTYNPTAKGNLNHIHT